MGYKDHILNSGTTFFIKEKEKEEFKWDEADITEHQPTTWYPGDLFTSANYRGPTIVYEDHYNDTETQEAWTKKERAEYWCQGESVEYGHDNTHRPHVRLVYSLQRGKSMWYPLYEAAHRWQVMKEKAFDDYKKLLQTARTTDQHGPQGIREVDNNGYLLQPREDEVPHREQSSSDDADDTAVSQQ